MKISKTLRMVVMALATVMLGACEGVPIKLGSDAGPVLAGANAIQLEAKSCGFQLLLFIPINVNTRHAHAWQALQAKAHGKALTDIKLKDEWFWGGVGTIYCTTLAATASDGAVKPVSHAAPVPAQASPTPAAAKPSPMVAPPPATVAANVPAAVPAAAPAATAAPAAVMSAPAPQPVAAPAVAPPVSTLAPASADGAIARDGASLRDRPMLANAGAKILAVVPAGTPLMLKQKISNRYGIWWYVGAETRGEGWIREQELDRARP